MKPFRHLIILVALAFSLILIADGAEESPRAPRRTAAELKRLQGKWEGVVAGDKSGDKITITITGNSLHFHRDKDFWFETTSTLPAGTDPQQLHATIKGSAPSQSSAIGKVVVAIFKIEDGTLTLAAMGDGSEPMSFEAIEDKGLTIYELRKVQPQKKNTGLPKPDFSGDFHPASREIEQERRST
jgi:uncharacterized protein (TIGR03067 family)